MRDHDYASGMLWMARSLEIAPTDDANLQWQIRANLAGWYRYILPPLCMVGRLEATVGAGTRQKAFVLFQS